MFGKLKLYLVLLVSVIVTLNACSNTEQRSNSIPPATTSPSSPETTPSTSQVPASQPNQPPNQDNSQRPELSPSTATDSSSPGKPSADQAPNSQPSQTPRQENSTAKDTTGSLQAARKNYNPISLTQLTKSNTTVGDDPKALAVAAFGDVASEGGSREVTVDYPQPNQAVVTIIQTGVADDSIRGIKYRTELVPTSKSAQTSKQWKLVWAGSQVKCQPGRGSQNWTTERCQ